MPLRGSRFLALAALAVLAACAEPVTPTDPEPGSARATSDRPDAVTGRQVHVIYALPADVPDRALDTLGVLDRSVGSFQAWLRARTGGRELRMDRHEGRLDVTFVRLTRTDAVMTSYGAFVRDSLERELRRGGSIRSDKIYAVYYDGGSTWACGAAAWPPEVPGQVAAMYLNGTPGGVSCARPFAAADTAFPGYWEFAMLHDLLHVMALVDPAAPHHTADRPAHVPEPTDLMYSGAAPWVLDARTTIDVGGDDYYGPAVPAGVRRLVDSPYLTPALAAAPPSAPGPAGLAVEGLPPGLDVSALPFHPPFPPPAAPPPTPRR